jgi:hypothetical protein
MTSANCEFLLSDGTSQREFEVLIERFLNMIKFKAFFMYRFLALGIMLVLASDASAQQVSEVLDSTLISVSQESMPPDDSGGRWVETNLILTNHSALPVRAYNFYPVSFNDDGLYQDSRFDDSAFFRADSIFPNWDPKGSIGYDKPWEPMRLRSTE